MAHSDAQGGGKPVWVSVVSALCRHSIRCSAPVDPLLVHYGFGLGVECASLRPGWQVTVDIKGPRRTLLNWVVEFSQAAPTSSANVLKSKILHYHQLHNLVPPQS